MSTSYYIYTEIKYNGKWICLNNKIKKVKGEKEEMAVTYYSGSRSYFGETYNKLEAMGDKISKKELSNELREMYGNEKDEFEDYPVVVDFEKMKKCIPKRDLYEHHGYVYKDMVASYLLKEQEDIYEWLDLEEYNKLSDDDKKFYEYFEWNDEQGWFKYFKKIIEHVNWQLYEWQDVNHLEEVDKVRLVVFWF